MARVPDVDGDKRQAVDITARSVIPRSDTTQWATNDDDIEF